MNTTGRNISEALENCIEKCDAGGVKLEWDKVERICSYGAPCMVGNRNSCISLLEEYLEQKLFSHHCILHTEALCAKDMDFNHVINPVVRCVNMNRSRALNITELGNLLELTLACSESHFFFSELDLNNSTPHVQMEILEIQKHSELCGSRTTPSLNQFRIYVANELFRKLHDLVLRFICRFGSTNIFEQIFFIYECHKKPISFRNRRQIPC
ncbi:hypothetical protein PR048_006011 [Dryococelus australis]|uniref:Uncharacterized protein n=1 Tax=Dryococelus australis TaxID=614101 RepID=A0ABQ9I9S5_9NEOP|nr:hypothetical protein PR048_006011 [Dryococelus australis]